MGGTRDTLGRPLRDLRISLTDRCNMRCGYCMPREVFGHDFRFMPRSELLSFEEIARFAGVAARLGVAKVRLTGGEPLMRKDVPELVAMLRAVDGIEDIALTTNGLLLERHAEALKLAGLDRVTVSLDTLEEDLFRSMADAPVSIQRVLAGIDAALGAGLEPVKVNMVVRRGLNDGCVLDMAEHFRGRPEILRFIEFMDVGESNGWTLDEVVPAREILASISERWPLRPLSSDRQGEVASRWAYEDGEGELGVISSVSEPFCHGCTRARLSADGKLYTCLFATTGADMRALLRDGAGDEQIEARLDAIWGGRGDRYSELRAAAEGAGPKGRGAASGGRPPRPPRVGAKRKPRVEMSYIGG
jgi:cyclic pyranopterin phosphate synthase